MKPLSSVAVLIDVENIHYSTLNNYSETPDWARIVDVCKTFGRISSIQAFGDWIEFQKEIPEIQSNGIQPIFVPLSQDGKSSLDCYLTVSAMKLFFQNETVDTLILASGDRDYIPLISELKAMGKNVIILAVPGTLSKDLTTIVDEVIPYKPVREHRVLSDVEEKADVTTFKHFVVETLRELESNSVNDRWVNLASIGLALKKRDAGFSHTKYGYKKLAEMLEDNSEIELKFDNYEKTIALARTCNPVNRAIQNKALEGVIHNLKNGYGFIKPNDQTENIFFHSSKLINVNLWDLKVGDKVRYSTYNTDRGLNAENVEKRT